MASIQFESTTSFRLIFIALGGIFVAGLLTWFMYFLIQTGEQKLDESRRSYMLDFVRVKRDESSERKERVPEKAPIEKAPPAPDIPQMDDSSSDIDAIPISALAAGRGGDVDINAFNIGTGDGEFLPIVKVVPVYPYRSLNAQFEGSCAVIYTVSANGSTKDIRVLEERCPHKDFQKPSVKAASKFKYKPKVLNGEAVEVHNVVNTFIFKLYNSEDDTE